MIPSFPNITYIWLLDLVIRYKWSSINKPSVLQCNWSTGIKRRMGMSLPLIPGIGYSASKSSLREKSYPRKRNRQKGFWLVILRSFKRECPLRRMLKRAVYHKAGWDRPTIWPGDRSSIPVQPDSNWSRELINMNWFFVQDICHFHNRHPKQKRCPACPSMRPTRVRQLGVRPWRSRKEKYRVSSVDEADSSVARHGFWLGLSQRKMEIKTFYAVKIRVPTLKKSPENL